MTNIESKQGCLLTSEHIRENLIVHNQDDGGVLQTYQDAQGSVSMVVYNLFPGVELIRKDVNRLHFLSNWREDAERKLVIEHCWKGRMECRDGTACMYPAPGDLILYRIDRIPLQQYYPLGNFRSFAISIDLDTISPKVEEQLEFHLEELMKRHHLDKCFFSILKETAPMVRVFEDIHFAPEPISYPYWRLKSLELLLLLSSCPVQDRPKERKISNAQAGVAKAARKYLLEHPYERITIEELAAMFSVSASHLKEGFRIVYGVSIKRFDREHKMQLAAQLLRETNQAVGEIARLFGYVNTSKFSSAFLSIHDKNPNEYRIEHQIEYP